MREEVLDLLAEICEDDVVKEDLETELFESGLLDSLGFAEFLVDLEDHLRVTGAANERVLKNLEYLAASGRLFEVRTVVVPELFDCEKTVRETARLAASYLGRGNIRYKIIAYRPMGVREAYSHYHVPDQAFLDHLAELARREGMTDVLVV